MSEYAHTHTLIKGAGGIGGQKMFALYFINNQIRFACVRDCSNYVRKYF